ncbi:hypothetical protein HMPREF3214_01485 [Alloscardovia omnicolens]|uniref:Uncharacterized protein n=1 Tax=Alloscardovia omnicolens F0580 TaxID=1321816 RepID=U1QVN7_9BIFI|nr:hypothetical protein HMPREF9244_00485 [Alloscardovia omnicolens F0580]KWZ73410.1 hypothetical protein HMPREF3214_01485 [Alloscardovia omnicolens]
MFFLSRREYRITPADGVFLDNKKERYTVAFLILRYSVGYSVKSTSILS